MQYLTWLLAWRYLRTTAYEKSSSTMIKICCFSIFIGSFSLGLVTAIMQGFEIVTHEKMQGIHSQAIIQSAHDENLDVSALNTVIMREFPAVIATSPSMTEHAIIINPHQETTPTMIILKGIDALQEAQVTTLERTIIKMPSQYSNQNNLGLSHLIHDDGLIIGVGLARELNLAVGDPCELFFTDEVQPNKRTIKLNKAQGIVNGIFKTGIEEFDSGFVFCSLQLLKSLFPQNGVSQLHLKFAPHVDERKVIAQLQQRLNLFVYSWKDMYPALVSALRLEKYVMFLILIIIMIIASMNMISLLFMQITYKRSDIAILQAMGCSKQNIQKIFFLIGTLITSISSFTGLLGAYVCSMILEYYPFIKIPDIYYVSYLPAKINIPLLGIIFIIIMIINSCALLLPIRRTSYASIADILRFEG